MYLGLSVESCSLKSCPFHQAVAAVEKLTMSKEDRSEQERRHSFSRWRLRGQRLPAIKTRADPFHSTQTATCPHTGEPINPPKWVIPRRMPSVDQGTVIAGQWQQNPLGGSEVTEMDLANLTDESR